MKLPIEANNASGKKRQTSWIELHFPDNTIKSIKPMSSCRGIRSGVHRPNGFIWYSSTETPITTELVKWLQTEFKYMFLKDIFDSVKHKLPVVTE